MKAHALLCIVGLASVIACQSANRSEEHGNEEQTYCFLRTEGAQHQDTSYIQLVVRDGTVSGIYHVIPYEKDARRGAVLGKLTDDVFDLVWTYTQEGMQDTLRVVFKQQDGTLMQKPLTVDTLTGRQVTMDSSSFSEAYESVNCAPTTERARVDSL